MRRGATLAAVAIAFVAAAASAGSHTATGAPGADAAASAGSHGAPGPPRADAAATRISFAASDRDVTLGRRVRFRGRLTRPTAARRRVLLQADPVPYDRFRTVARTRTGGEGRFRLSHRPRRNTRYRAVARTDPRLTTRAVTVYADLAGGILYFRSLGGDRAAIRVFIDVPRYARLPGRRVQVYVAHDRRPTARRAGAALLRRSRGRRWTATVRFTMSGLGPRSYAIFCVRELEPDEWGRPRPIDRLCGRRRIAKSRF
jgi:hypothetical protein